jgi:hypothetical protein
MKKYDNNGGTDATRYAQCQLMGKTHYVDPDTLRWHKSKITYARPIMEGHLFMLVTSDALDMNNTRRGFRAVVFDVSGHVVYRPKLDTAEKTTEKAIKAAWVALESISLAKVYADMKARIIRAHSIELNELDELAASVEGK